MQLGYHNRSLYIALFVLFIYRDNNDDISSNKVIFKNFSTFGTTTQLLTATNSDVLRFYVYFNSLTVAF
jgi:hypothetical protein